ncbi:MAG: PqqD family protein [Polyangiaceae bacterium]
MSIAEDDRISCPPEVLSRVLDGEAVLLHLGSGTYFGMNEVATRAWELISSGTTYGALRRTLLDEFEVASEQLDSDLRAFVGELGAQRLVTVTPS